MSERFNFGFNPKRPTEKRKGSDIPDEGSQEGSVETGGSTQKAPSSKSNLTDFKKLFLIGSVGAITAIVAGAVVKRIRKDDDS